MPFGGRGYGPPGGGKISKQSFSGVGGYTHVKTITGRKGAFTIVKVPAGLVTRGPSPRGMTKMSSRGGMKMPVTRAGFAVGTSFGLSGNRSRLWRHMGTQIHHFTKSLKKAVGFAMKASGAKRSGVRAGAGVHVLRGGDALHGMRASPSGKIHVKAHSVRAKGGKMVRVKAHFRKRGGRRR